MRALKVKAVLSVDRKTFDLITLEQTHFNEEFGGGQYPGIEDSSSLKHSFISSEKVLIISSFPPPKFQVLGGVYTWDHPRVDIIIRPTCSVHRDLCVIRDIPYEYWPRIKRAVEEYNEFYKDK